MHPYIIGNANSKFAITSYGLMLALGILAALLLFRFLCGKKKISDDSYNFYSFVGILAIAAGLFFAMLFQTVYNWIDTGVFEWGGLTFMGGLIGGAGAFILITVFYRRRIPALLPHDATDTAALQAELDATPETEDAKRAQLLYEIREREDKKVRNLKAVKAAEAQKAVRGDFFKVAEIAAPCILIAHALGRIGCFLAGCCYGSHTDSWLGVEFPFGDSVGKVHPTNLYEALFLFVMFGLMLTVTLLDKPKGYNLIAYALSYSVFRFLIEFIRDDNRGSFIPGLSPSQWQVILLFIAGLALLGYKLYKDYYKRPVPAESAPDNALIEDADDAPTENDETDTFQDE